MNRCGCGMTPDVNALGEAIISIMEKILILVAVNVFDMKSLVQ